MESPIFRELTTQKLLIQKIIWAALTGSILVYGGVAYALPELGEAIDGGAQDISIFFVALAIASGVGSLFLRKFLFSDEGIKRQLEKPIDPKQLSTDRQTGQLNEEKLNKIESLNEFEQKLLSLLNWYFVPNLVCWGLNESIAIYGLVLAIFEGSPNTLLPFAGAALLLNFTMFPKFDSIVGKARNLSRAF